MEQQTDGRRAGGAELVLVHGSPGDGRVWRHVVKETPAGTACLTPDLPGYGQTEPLPAKTGPRTQAMAAVIAELIESRAKPVILTGHSYGGNVALHAALRKRERIKALLLLEPVFMRGLALAGDQAVLQKTQAFFGDYTDRVSSGDNAAVGMMIDFWFGSGAFSKMPPAVQGYLQSEAAKNAVDVRAAFSEVLTAPDLAAFDRPVIIACGSKSPGVVMAIAESLCDLLPNADMVSLTGANHGMLDSHPREIAQLIRQLDET